MQFLEIFIVIFKATGIQNVPYSVVKKINRQVHLGCLFQTLFEAMFSIRNYIQ